MPGFLAHDACAVIKGVFQYRRCWNPQLSNLNAAVALVLGRMLMPKEIAIATSMVIIKVGKAHDIIVVALCGPQVRLQFSR